MELRIFLSQTADRSIIADEPATIELSRTPDLALQLTEPSANGQETSPGSGLVDDTPPARPATPQSAAHPIAKLYLSPEEAQKALEHLRLLCFAKDEDPTPLEIATDALREAGYKQDVSKILHRALMLPEVNPHVGALWVRRVVSRRRWDGRYPRHMDKLCRRGEVGRRAVIEFLELAGARRLRRHINRVIRKHGRWLREHPKGWQVAVKVLAQQGDYRKVINWFGDWHLKSEADLELLFCLVLALRTTGRERAAHEIVQVARNKPGNDQQHRILGLWFVFEEALAGNTQSAFDNFKEMQPAGWDEYSTCLYYLARGLIRVQQAPPAERKEAFDRDYHRIRERFRITRVDQCGTLVRREYRRCLCRMAKDAGIWSQRIQATWRSADSWLFLVPLLLVPPLQLLAPVYLFRLAIRPRPQFLEPSRDAES